MPSMLKPCIRFTKKRKLSSFCDFILADAPARAKHIRHLEFNSMGEIDDDELVEKFAQVLEQATSIERLEFNQCDDFIASSEQISEAFARLKSVKYLKIHDADSATVDMVKHMQSPVEDVFLSVNGSSDADQDPVSILSSFQQTLRRLYTWTPDFSDDTQDITYPNLHTLDATFWNNIDMAPMIRAFPNLRKLSLYLQGFDDGGLEEEKEEIREKNEQAQEAARWAHLEQVHADDINLFISALKADVDAIDLDLNWQSEAESITTILGDARPTRLNFCYSSDWDNETEATEHITGLLEAASADVTHLYFTVRDIEDPEPLLTFLCEVMPTLPRLAGLSLELTVKNGVKVSEEELASRFATAASSLQSIVLSQPPSDSVSFWQIEKPEGDNEAAPRRLTEEESEKLGIVVEPTFPAFDADC
ncbi:hypothetical protein EIP86_004972 [Pleurotus ostreatoroseus]|nr:hypothetical protein EIP86_004972 [Pleurotus ostreatoroseus]